MPSRLLTIVSYDNLPEAEWAQSRLAQAEIQSSLTNGNLVSCCWQYLVAVGGIKLQVPESDVETAVDLLYWDVVADADNTACPACGEILDSGWEVCWRCGKDFSGIAEPDSTTLPNVPAESPQQDGFLVWQSIAVVATGLFLLCTRGLVALFIWCGFVSIARMVFSMVAASNRRLAPETVVEVVGNDDNQLGNSRCDQFARRALKSALLGFLYFPPLTVHSIWLALRINLLRKELSGTGRINLNVAILMNGITVLLWVTVFGLMFFSAYMRSMEFESAYQLGPWKLDD